MDLSSNFSFSRCPPQISASGAYVAYVYGSKLVIRYAQSLESKDVIQLPQDFAQTVGLIRWDKCLKHSPEQRLAVVSKFSIRTYSIKKKLSSSGNDIVDKSSGNSILLSGNEEISNVQWLSADSSDGDYQIVRLAVFTKYHLDVKIWSSNGLEMEIQSPKFPMVMNNSPRLSLDGLTNRFSVLTRFTTFDVLYNCRLTGNDPKSEIIIPLNKALDIVDLKWSDSGLWLAGIDNPITGYNVHLWAADGTYLNCYQDSINHNLSNDIPVIPSSATPTCLKWLNVYNDPGKKDFELLLVGDSENRISFLDLKTFQPHSIICHGSVYENCCLWEEYLSPESHDFEYRMVALPFILGNNDKDITDKKYNKSVKRVIHGVTSINISDNGQLLATRLESVPHVVWIWSLGNLDNPELIAVISHNSPIRTVQWRPESNTSTLIITPTDSKIVGIWNYENQLSPEVIDLNSKFEYPILGVDIIGSDGLTLLMWTKDSFIVGSTGERIDQDYDNDQEDDRYPPIPRGISHQNVLNPILLQDEDTKVKLLADVVQQSEWIQDSTLNVPLEDTFHNKLKF